MSHEQYDDHHAARLQDISDIVDRHGPPIVLGGGAAIGTGFIANRIGLSEGMNRHNALGREIANLEYENNELSAAKVTLGKAGIEVHVGSVVATNEGRIAELQAEKDQLGSPVAANVEFFALPITVWVAVAAFGLNRTIRKKKARK